MSGQGDPTWCHDASSHERNEVASNRDIAVHLTPTPVVGRFVECGGSQSDVLASSEMEGQRRPDEVCTQRAEEFRQTGSWFSHHIGIGSDTRGVRVKGKYFERVL